MDEWEEFCETSLPEEFYSNLNIEDTTDADYIHAKRVCRDFKTKHLGEYHDLYLKSDTLLLTNVFENFYKMCIYGNLSFRSCNFLSAPASAWQTASKRLK